MITLRLARMEDASTLARIHTLSRVTAMPWLPRLHTPEEDIWWMETIVLPEQEVWVAEINEVIVGLAAIHGDMLEQLYILPEYQGQGVGSALLRKAIEVADAPVRLWVFQENKAARAFYEHHGFAPITFTDGADNEEKTPDVLYELQGNVSLAESDKV